MVDIQVHYPASELHPLPSGAVFSLALCYQPHCTVSDSLWNQTAPGAPYDPRLTIFQGDYAGNDLFVKRVTLPEHPGEDVVVFATIYAAFDPPGNPFGSCAVKDACNTSGFDPVSNACVHVGMPYRSVRQSTGKLLVVAAKLPLTTTSKRPRHQRVRASLAAAELGFASGERPGHQ